MNCRRCGSPLVAGAEYCTKCGAPVSGIPLKKKRKSGCLIASLIVGGVLLLCGVGLLGIALLANLGASADPTPAPVSKEIFVSLCSEMDYNLFARQPEENTNKAIQFTGEIVQIMGESNVEMRIALRKPTDLSPDYDRIVYTTYKMPEGALRLLEGDLVQVYGNSTGIKTYLSVLGGEIQLPLVKAKFVDVLSDTNGPSAAPGVVVQKDAGIIGDYDVKILSASTGKTDDDKVAVILKFEWKNNSAEAIAFTSALDVTVYQNGVQLNSAYLLSSKDNNVDAAYNKIQPGISQTVSRAFELGDTSEIEVEVTPAFNLDDKVKVIKTLSPK